MVKARLVQIGNSQGIRIPKALIEQLNLQNEVTLEVKEDRLLIRAAYPPRHDWKERFALAAAKPMTEAENKEEADLLAFTNAPHLSSWEQNEGSGDDLMASSPNPAPLRLDVYLVELDPTVGSEMQKTWPCVVVSPNEFNLFLATVVVAPLTTGRSDYPTRIVCRFQNKDGAVALDHIRSVDKTRLLKRLGRLSQSEGEAVLTTLSELFAP